MSSLAATLSLGRPRLVELCARITGDADAAEDLAQETLLEAWRHLYELRDQERFPQFGVILSGYLVEWIGIQPSLLILGACYLLTTLTLLVNPALRKMEKTA